MNIFKLTKRLFIRSKSIIAVLAVFSAYILYSSIKIILTCGDFLMGVSGLLEFSLYSFTVFAFVSYEFGRICKVSDVDECLCSMQNGYKKFVTTQLAILLRTVAVFCAFSALTTYILMLKSSVFTLGTFILMTLSCLLSFFLIPCLGVFLGTVLSQRVKRVNAYLFLVFSTLLGSSLSSGISGLAYEFGINIYPLMSVFNIFPPSLNWRPVYAFGQSVLPYRWELTVFWLCLLIFILIRTFSDKSDKRLTAKTVLIPAVGALCLVLAVLPSSKLILDGDDPINSIMCDWSYYMRGKSGDPKDDVSKKSEPEFKIDKYTMDISIGSQLKVKAEMEPDSSELSQYEFTLYHGYEVDEIKNQDGDSLSFVRDGDYITVEALTDVKTDKIIIEYHGYSGVYYSNLQGSFLPSYFPYYPHAGFSPVYDRLRQDMHRVECEESEFYVRIHGLGQFYSNLTETKSGVFEGTAQGLTLLSGFYKSVETDGLTIVYPYLNNMELSEDSLLEFAEKHYGTESLKSTVKKVLIVPHINNSSVYVRYVPYDEYLLITEISEFDSTYEDQIIPSGKHPAYSALEGYKASPDEYRKMVDSARGGLTYKTCNEVFLDFIDEYGEEFAFEKLDEYLNDDSDTRAWEEFFADFDKEKK